MAHLGLEADSEPVSKQLAVLVLVHECSHRFFVVLVVRFFLEQSYAFSAFLLLVFRVSLPRMTLLRLSPRFLEFLLLQRFRPVQALEHLVRLALFPLAIFQPQLLLHQFPYEYVSTNVYLAKRAASKPTLLRCVRPN